MMENANELTLGQASIALASGELSSKQLISQSLDRISERDSIINAWTCIDREGAVEAAIERDSQSRMSPLHGIPFAVKDIIDTAALPTEYGCAAYAGHVPQKDAQIVTKLEDLGAVMLGKTVTTEFAYYAPGATRNARNPEHTPGGSSSGSAASVADCHAQFSLGTQTAGSMIRPGAFNGIVGLKPTFGVLPLEGVHTLACSMDTLGFFTRAIGDQRLLLSATAPQLQIRTAPESPTIAVCRTPWWQKADDEMQAAFERYTAQLKESGFKCVSYSLPAIFEDLAEAQFTLMALEASRALQSEFEQHHDQLRSQTIDFIEHGLRVTIRQEAWARNLAAQAQYRLQSIFQRFDVVMTPPTLGAAPFGIGNTGDPLFNRVWTFLGVPCITYPIATADNGLPIGIQLISSFGNDHQLIDMADKMNIA